MYRIVRQQNQTVANVLSSQPLKISFRRAFVGERARLWTDLVSMVVNVNLVEAGDKWEWNLGKHHVFTVKSMYRDIIQTGKISENGVLWKIRILLRIKIFFVVLEERGNSHKG